MGIDESANSLVDFDLSESKFTMGGFFDKTQGESQHEKTVALSKQGTDSEMPSAIKLTEQKNSHGATMLNKSGTLNRSSGGPDDADFNLSMDDTDFGLSESNFSQRLGNFTAAGSNSGVSSTNTQSAALRANLARDRAQTLAEKKSSIMSKNLIAEEDELVSETDGLGASLKKSKKSPGDDDDDEDDDYSMDDFD